MHAHCPDGANRYSLECVHPEAPQETWSASWFRAVPDDESAVPVAVFDLEMMQQIADSAFGHIEPLLPGDVTDQLLGQSLAAVAVFLVSLQLIS